MREQEVGLILFLTQLMNDAGRHGECRDPRRSDHGVDLLLCEDIDQLREEYATGGIKDKCHKSQAEDQKGGRIQKSIRLHLLGDGDSQKECDQVRENRLCGLGKGIQHTAFPDQISEHQETDQGNRIGGNQPREDGDKDREDDPCGL